MIHRRLGQDRLVIVLLQLVQVLELEGVGAQPDHVAVTAGAAGPLPGRIRQPFTKVPLVEPRSESSTMGRCPLGCTSSSRAWCRLTSGSGSWTWFSGDRPRERPTAVSGSTSPMGLPT